jgi:AraC family transcriptional regulator
MRDITVKEHQRRLGKVIAYIETHLNEVLTLEQLSQIACLSPYHFHRIFREEIGESLYEHIKRLRLEDAAFKLKHSDNSIDKISAEAGYERNTSFSRAFRQHFGQSPRRYRVAWQLENEMAKTRAPVARLLILTGIDVVYVRGTGDYAHAAQDAWQSLMSQAYRAGLINADTKAYGITYDSPDITADSQIRYDACISVEGYNNRSQEFRQQTIKGGHYAVFRHQGAYENLDSIYSAIYQIWLPQSGKQLRDLPSFCHYHQLDTRKVPAECLVTDIFLPIE